MREIVILPGIGGSGEAHWQTHWEKEQPNMRRFAPASWEYPDLGDWVASLDRAVESVNEPPILVAHSLACLLIPHWRQASSRRIAGAFLVAVPDPSSASFPKEAAAFAEVPEGHLDFPSLIIASSDDPFGTTDYARRRAAQWGSGLVQLGALGHLNGPSGLGRWQEGLTLLAAFAAGVTAPA